MRSTLPLWQAHRSISCKAVIDTHAYLETRAPINQVAICFISHPFPSEVIESDVACLMQPPDPPKEKEKNAQERYLQMATTDRIVRRRYITWLSRLRKFRRKTNKLF